MGRPAKPDCPVETTLELLTGKWKANILFHLLSGAKRTGELRRLMADVTQQMLTAHLRALERDGIIHRKVYAQVPPKVEYSLTPLGRSLGPVFDKIYEWGEVYLRSFKQSGKSKPTKKSPGKAG
jgi:DNA-binding HxlR family transcriptional regulator